MTKTMGQHIRELRDAADLSLRELAKKMGSDAPSAAFLSDVELGRRHPSEKVLITLARALGTSAEELLTYDTRPPMDEMRRMAAENPKYGLAFRTIVDKQISPEQLLQLAKGKRDRKK